jgi:hypothetical protein
LYLEYGAWRKFGHHEDKIYNGDEKDAAGWTENYMCQFHEAYLRQGLQAKDNYCGHFVWIFATFPTGLHRNRPEGIGVWEVHDTNCKGLLTMWREPADAFFLYHSFYTDKTKPMVYIVSRTWTDRWSGPGKKSNIVIYSNCDEVELYNDFGGTSSLGKQARVPLKSFSFDNVDVKYNVLHAVGRVGGKQVAANTLIMDNLPKSPNFGASEANAPNTTAPDTNAGDYVWRINCAGPKYTDVNGNEWKADQKYVPGQAGSWGTLSWMEQFKDHYRNYEVDKGTWTRAPQPIAGTRDDVLYQTSRFGHKLNEYKLPVDNGTYVVELHFTEPWYGLGYGSNISCEGWRIFDVAMEGKLVLDDVDIWKWSGGHCRALKIPIYNVSVTDGMLDITFPEIKVNQTVIAAIAVAKQTGTVGTVHSLADGPGIRISSFNSGLTIGFKLPTNASVNLIAMNGRMVWKVDVTRSHSVTIPKSSLSAGFFLLKITTPEKTILRRICNTNDFISCR